MFIRLAAIPESVCVCCLRQVLATRCMRDGPAQGRGAPRSMRVAQWLLLAAAATTGVGAANGDKCPSSVDLQKIKLSALLNMAKTQSGIDSGALNEAMDSDSPKAAIVKLLQRAHPQCGAQAGGKKMGQGSTGGTGAQKRETRTGAGAKRRQEGKKKFGKQKTFIAHIRSLWESLPDKKTVAPCIYAAVAMLAVGALFKIRMAVLEAPNLVEHGAPKFQAPDGKLKPIPAKKKPAAAGQKQSNPLMKKLREAIEANMDDEDTGTKSGAKPVVHATRQFAGEDLESRKLSQDNLRALAAVVAVRSAANRKRCWFGENCYRTGMTHRKEYAHPGDGDWTAALRIKAPLKVKLAGPTSAAMKACSKDFEDSDGFRDGAPIPSVIRYIAHHTGLLHQFLRQVMATAQPVIKLPEEAMALSHEQFCVVLQASRETARLMEAGATVDDIDHMKLSVGCPIRS